MRALAGTLAGLVLLGIVAACGGAGSPGPAPVQATPGVTAAPAAPATSAPTAGAPAAPATAGSDYGY
jgi:hypothetical protein